MLVPFFFAYGLIQIKLDTHNCRDHRASTTTSTRVMTDSEDNSRVQEPLDAVPRPELPFAAPCRDLSLSAPWRWLMLGFKDTRRAPLMSLGFGTLMSGLVAMLIYAAWTIGSAWIVFCALLGSVFLLPLICIGTYAISAQLERGLTVSLRRTLRAAFKQYIGTELVFALVLLVVFLVWARASSMISIFLPSSDTYSAENMVVYLSAFTLVGSVFLAIIFAASVFALPMIMHRDVDAITAIVSSINAVLRNKLVMLYWAGLILLGMCLSLLTGGVLLVLFLPAVGHAVWHGYRETIDASQFPRHKMGITASSGTVELQ